VTRPTNEQRTHAERDILDAAIDEKGRGRANTAAAPRLLVFPNPLQVNPLLHFRSVAPKIELEPLRIPVQVVQFQMALIIEQQIVHRPEPALRARAFRRFGCMQRVRMHLLERKMTVDDAYPAFEMLQQQFDGRRRLLAVRAFEITVLGDGDRRVRRAERVVGRIRQRLEVG